MGTGLFATGMVEVSGAGLTEAATVVVPQVTAATAGRGAGPPPGPVLEGMTALANWPTEAPLAG